MGRRAGDRDPRGRLSERTRNTARVQIGIAIACLIVAALLVSVDALPGTMTGIPGALVALGLGSVWMFRRGWRALQATAMRPMHQPAPEGRASR